MTTTQTTPRPAGHAPRHSKSDEAAIRAYLATITDEQWTDNATYAEVTATADRMRRQADARACRRIIAKLTWMILDEQDTDGRFPGQIAELTELAEWLEAQD